MAMKKRVLPKFNGEAEEAEWWYQNRGRVSRDLRDAAKRGEVKVLTTEKLRERLRASAAR